jgi:hypothetical protein
MQTKLRNIVNDQFRATFQKLYKSPDIKAVASFKLTSLGKALNEHNQHYEEARLKLCKQYAKKNEAGEAILFTNPENGIQRYEFEPKDGIDFQRELHDLLDQNVDLPDPALTLADIAQMNLSPEDIEHLIGIAFKEA